MINVSDAEFDRAVESALAEVPPAFREYLENVVIEVQRRPTRQLMAEYDVPGDLLGLYMGVPLEEASRERASPLPDRIVIFRDNLCAMCDTREELVDEIRITVLHEIGHHFGMDEDQLEALGYD
jgi:predicted Zn-dependent protease with MMP-like domain